MPTRNIKIEAAVRNKYLAGLNILFFALVILLIIPAWERYGRHSLVDSAALAVAAVSAEWSVAGLDPSGQLGQGTYYQLTSPYLWNWPIHKVNKPFILRSIDPPTLAEVTGGSRSKLLKNYSRESIISDGEVAVVLLAPFSQLLRNGNVPNQSWNSTLKAIQLTVIKPNSERLEAIHGPITWYRSRRGDLIWVQFNMDGDQHTFLVRRVPPSWYEPWRDWKVQGPFEFTRNQNGTDTPWLSMQELKSAPGISSNEISLEN